MKVLSIGTDRKIFDQKSPVFLRSLKYASEMDALHVLVFTLKKEKNKAFNVGNLFVYPTNSLTRWFYMKDALSLGKRIIKDKGLSAVDSVVSTQDAFQTGWVGAKLSKRFSLPLQVQVHTDFLSKYFKTSVSNMIRLWMANRVIPRAEGVRVVSETVKDSIYKHYKNIKAKVEILPVFVDIEKIVNFVPTKDIRKDFPQYKFTVFMASRLSKEKRFDTALFAFKKVLEKYPQAGLVIAGSGPEKKNIERLAQKLGIEKNVSLIGWQDDLISYFKTCNVFLLTSEYEGYGMTLIEAGASGTMIVTTRVGLAKTDLFVDEVNCHICEVSDSACLANCIVNVINNNQEREVFSHRIQDAVKAKSVSIDEYSSKYVKLLSDLLVR